MKKMVYKLAPIVPTLVLALNALWEWNRAASSIFGFHQPVCPKELQD